MSLMVPALQVLLCAMLIAGAAYVLYQSAGYFCTVVAERLAPRSRHPRLQQFDLL
jgi:hypothetical protein